ncbi:MAG: hypothetical protein M3370_00345 [Actinomycetota bacterium]|nr:hypothetical protein [Actinomycetota bacterium]
MNTSRIVERLSLANRKREIASLVCAIVVCLLAAPPLAQAATYTTTGCDGAPTWRVLYRMYFSDSDGITVQRAGEVEAVYLRSVQTFVDEVGRFSRCGIRVAVDVERSATPFTSLVDTFPATYDSLYTSMPQRYDDNQPRYRAQTFARHATYPIATDRVPISVDLTHEWMHQAIDFWYETPLGWLTRDCSESACNTVHGRCSAPGTVCPEHGLFEGLLTGTIIENGTARGLPIDQYRAQGTPAHPRNFPLEVDQPEVLDVDGRRTLSFATRAGAPRYHVSPGFSRSHTYTDVPLPVRAFIRDARGSVVQDTPADLTMADLTTQIPLGAHPRGLYTLCFSGRDDEPIFSPPEVCAAFTVVDGAPGLATPQPDRTRPVITGLRFASRTLLITRRGRTRQSTGMTVSLSLSEPASVRFSIERKTVGRRVGSRCVRRTAANHRRKRCDRYAALGSFNRLLPPGASKVHLNGRVHNRLITAGTYRLAVIATDAAGQRSVPRRATFRVVQSRSRGT